MFLSSLSLRNLCCFRDIKEMTFQYPGRVGRDDGRLPPALSNVNLLLGDNGTGKTALLRGISLALIAPVAKDSGLRPYNLVRRVYRDSRGRPPQVTAIRASVLLTAQDLDKKKTVEPTKSALRIQLYRSGDNDYIGQATRRSDRWGAFDYDKSPAFLVLGYGATRRIAPSKENISSRTKETHLRYQRVRGLFEDDFALVPLSYWLPNFENPGRRKQVINLLNRLLEGEYRFGGKLVNGEYVFHRQGASLPLPALSDGFRAFIGWVSDMLYHILRGIPSGKKLEAVEGVVMVDEIDLHLHPSWQRTIIRTLSTTFPRIQFIFTSHSPLVTGSLQWSNIWVMNQPRPQQLPNEPIYGLSADQVLQSKYFNLDSTRPPQVVKELRDLDNRAQKGDQGAAVEFMLRLSNGSEPQGYTDSKHPQKVKSRLIQRTR
jgi:hypothetical protein